MIKSLPRSSKCWLHISPLVNAIAAPERGRVLSSAGERELSNSRALTPVRGQKIVRLRRAILLNVKVSFIYFISFFFFNLMHRREFEEAISP